MNEYQWENYNRACQDLRQQYGPPDIENVIKAFKKGMLDTPGVTMKKLENNGRELWINVGSMLWNGIVYIFKVQAGVMVVCGLVGAAVTWEVPLVGAVIGARLGLHLTTFYFSLIGLGTAAAMIGQVAGTVSVYFDEGVRLAKAGNINEGAKQFAEGFAQLLQLVVALFILYCFVKGGQKVIKGMQNTLTAESRLITMLKNLPPAIGNFQAYVNHAKWGYAFKELKALKQMSAGDCIHVIRACNPSRIKVGKGIALEAKGLEIKGKSFKGGIYDGEVGVSLADILKFKKNYDVVPIKLNPNLVSGPKPKNQTSNMQQNAGYRLKLKEGKKGELDGHILEQTTYSAHGDNALKWRLLDTQGRPHVPDMDRVVCMKLDTANMKLQEMARMMDDPEEIAEFNRRFNQLVAEKYRINKVPVKHGYTAASANNKGKTIWHADTNETLLVFANGQMFEMTWNQFVLFCDANRALNMPGCFKLVK